MQYLPFILLSFCQFFSFVSKLAFYSLGKFCLNRVTQQTSHVLQHKFTNFNYLDFQPKSHILKTNKPQ